MMGGGGGEGKCGRILLSPQKVRRDGSRQVRIELGQARSKKASLTGSLS